MLSDWSSRMPFRPMLSAQLCNSTSESKALPSDWVRRAREYLPGQYSYRVSENNLACTAVKHLGMRIVDGYAVMQSGNF